MTIRKVNFGSMVVAGFVGGWLMWFVDFWYRGALGLWGMFPAATNWSFMFTHLIESVIFIIPFAWAPLYYRLPGPGWIKGLIYGTLWWFIPVFIVTLVAGALGASSVEILRVTSFGSFVSQLTLHWVWGIIAGLLYVPPDRGTPVL